MIIYHVISLDDYVFYNILLDYIVGHLLDDYVFHNIS